MDITIRQLTGRLVNVQDGAVPLPDGVAVVVAIVVAKITRVALDLHALLHALKVLFWFDFFPLFADLNEI